MPLITHSNYSPPAWLRNGHALTLWAALCRQKPVAATHPALHLETPAHGGHVGFVSPHSGPYWDEERAVAFVGEKFLSPGKRSYLLPV